MQGASQLYGVPAISHGAKDGVLLPGMGEHKRGQDEIARQNLLYVIEACSRRLGRSQGGQTYLAQLLGSTSPYISSVVRGYRDRNIGRDLKTKIEQVFNLSADWMDDEHGPEIVSWLVPRIPSLPRRQTVSKAGGVPEAYVRQLESTRAELEALKQRLAELESRRGPGSNTRK